MKEVGAASAVQDLVSPGDVFDRVIGEAMGGVVTSTFFVHHLRQLVSDRRVVLSFRKIM